MEPNKQQTQSRCYYLLSFHCFIAVLPFSFLPHPHITHTVSTANVLPVVERIGTYVFKNKRKPHTHTHTNKQTQRHALMQPHTTSNGKFAVTSTSPKFRVTVTFAIATRPVDRSDIDMKSQRRIITALHKTAQYEANLRRYIKTCASREAHATFVQLLLGEAAQFHSDSTQSAEFRGLMASVAKEMRRAANEANSDAFFENLCTVADWRLFEPDAPRRFLS